MIFKFETNVRADSISSLLLLLHLFRLRQRIYFALDLVDDSNGLLLLLPECCSLRIAALFEVGARVLRIHNHLFDAVQRSNVLLVLVPSDFLIDLEENNFESVLLLKQIHDLEVLLVELGLRLQNELLHDLHHVFVRLHSFTNGEEEEDDAEDDVEGPYKLQKEDIDCLTKRIPV